MIMFRNMLENALDQSEALKENTLTLSLSLYLFYGILGILSMQFSILAIQYDLGLALKNMALNVFQFYLLILVLLSDFGNIKIVKHQWRSLLARKQ